MQEMRNWDAGSIPGSWRAPGRQHGNPLQYSCLENPLDRGAWRATVHMVAKSQTWLKQLSTHAGKGIRRRRPWKGDILKDTEAFKRVTWGRVDNLKSLGERISLAHSKMTWSTDLKKQSNQGLVDLDKEGGFYSTHYGKSLQSSKWKRCVNLFKFLATYSGGERMAAIAKVGN